MDHIKDALQVNGLAIKRSLASIRYLPIIWLVLFMTTVVTVLTNTLLSQFGLFNIPFVGGLIAYLIDVAMMSILAASLSSVIFGGNLTLQNFTAGWQRFINPIMATRFIFWLIEMAIGLVIEPLFRPIAILSMLLAYAIQIFKSPLLESIYIGGDAGQGVIYSIIDFLKNNFVQWIPIMVLFGFLSNILLGYITAGASLLSNWGLLIIFAGQSLLLAFTYIYKGHLYNILHDSNMRKRKFMGIFNE